MLEGLSDVRWERERQPSWNASSEVPESIRALATATESTGKRAHDRLLQALGDAGTAPYHPVVLTVVPFLGELLVSGTAPARRWSLESLVALCGAFEPAPGFEEVDTPAGPKSLKSLLKSRVLEHADVLETLRADSLFEEESRLAADLLAKLGRAPKAVKPIPKRR